jgi:hypothetical protein
MANRQLQSGRLALSLTTAGGNLLWASWKFARANPICLIAMRREARIASCFAARAQKNVAAPDARKRPVKQKSTSREFLVAMEATSRQGNQ